MLNGYTEAINDGYSDKEISEYLAKETPDQLKSAIADGYSYGEIARHLSGINENEWQQSIADNKTRQHNLDTMGDVERGFKQGIQSTQAGSYGMVGLGGSLAKKAGEKTDLPWLERAGQATQDWGMKGYARNTREASLYPTKQINEVKGVGDFVDWTQGLVASQIPVIGEMVIGSALSGGLGYAAAKKIATKSASEMAKKMVSRQVKSGVLKATGRKAAEESVKNALVKGAMKGHVKKIASRSAKAGAFGSMTQLEAGHNYGELLHEHGVDAPGSSLAFGALSGAIELVGGNIGLVDDVVGAVAKKMPGSYLKRAVKRLVKNAPAEALQEAGQEVNSILNVVLNTDEKFLTPENTVRILESAVAGGMMGAAGASVQALSNKETSDTSQDQANQYLDDTNTRLAKRKTTIEPGKILADQIIQGLQSGELTLSEALELKKDGRFSHLSKDIDLAVKNFIQAQEGQPSEVDQWQNRTLEIPGTDQSEYGKMEQDALFDAEFESRRKQQEPGRDIALDRQILEAESLLNQYKTAENYNDRAEAGRQINALLPEGVSFLEGVETLEKKIAEFRRIQSQEASVKALEQRQQDMGANTPDNYRFQKGLGTRPDETQIPLPGDMPGFQRGVEDEGYKPFANLDTPVKAVVQPESPLVDDGINVGEADFEPSSVRDQRTFQKGITDNFGVQDLPAEAVPGINPFRALEMNKKRFEEAPMDATNNADFLNNYIATNGEDAPIATDRNKVELPGQDGDTEEYTYHTTNNASLEKISQSGLKQDSALSMDEETVKQWKPVKGDIILRVKGETKDGTYKNTRKALENVPPENIEIKDNGEWKPLQKKQPKTWFSLGEKVSTEYNDPTGNTSTLKPNKANLKEAAQKVGITVSDAELALSVYNSSDPGYEESLLRDRRIPISSEQSAPPGEYLQPNQQKFIKAYVDKHLADEIKRGRKQGLEATQEQIDAFKTNLTKVIQDFVNAINNRDWRVLKDRLHRGNKGSLKLFTDLTGLSTKTQKVTDENIRSLDPKGYDDWVRAETKTFEKKREEEKKAREEKERKDLLKKPVFYLGEKMTFEKYINTLFDSGYTDIEKKENGPFKTVRLLKHDSDGRTIKSELFRSKREIEYIETAYEFHSKKAVDEDIAKEQKEQKENPGDFISQEEEDHLFGKGKAEPKSKKQQQIDFFEAEFRKGTSFKTIVAARKALSKRLGAPIAKSGTQEAKNIDEAIEVAAVKVAKKTIAIIKKNNLPIEESFDALVELQDQMPNLSVRTSTSVKNQAYSTPLPLAFLASELAGIGDKTSVYEPSAGNGALVIGANPQNVSVNELNNERYQGLLNDGFAEVNHGDGTVFIPDKKQDVIIGNPPFGTVKNDAGKAMTWFVGGKYNTTQVDHAMVFKSLEAMKDGGRAVFIVGSVNDRNTTLAARKKMYRAGEKVRFYKTLYDQYNVVDHFSVAGKLYSKQGATWPVDVIVIDGKGKSDLSLPGAVPPPYLSTIEEVKEKLNETHSVDNARARARGADSGNGQAATGGHPDGITPHGSFDGQATGPDQPGTRPRPGSKEPGGKALGSRGIVRDGGQDNENSGKGSVIGEFTVPGFSRPCLLYTSDAADE